jgi:hypothetical protein
MTRAGIIATDSEMKRQHAHAVLFVSIVFAST